MVLSQLSRRRELLLAVLSRRFHGTSFRPAAALVRRSPLLHEPSTSNALLRHNAIRCLAGGGPAPTPPRKPEPLGTVDEPIVYKGVNPVPPEVTMDDMPVPHRPYAKVYAELQKKFNFWLAASAALFGATLFAFLYADVLDLSLGRAPPSYTKSARMAKRKRDLEAMGLTDEQLAAEKKEAAPPPPPPPEPVKKVEPAKAAPVAAAVAPAVKKAIVPEKKHEPKPEPVKVEKPKPKVEPPKPEPPKPKPVAPPPAAAAKVEKPVAESKALPIVEGKVAEAPPKTKTPRPPPPAAKPEAAAAAVPAAAKASKKVIPPVTLPDHVPYLLIGAGTASFAAFRAIRGRDAEAKVLVIGDEPEYPYMRPPLSKELWFTEDRKATSTLRFKQWNGKERSIYFESDEFYTTVDDLMHKEHGGVAVARGLQVVRIDPVEHKAHLSDGRTIKYDKCLIATGGTPKTLDIFKKNAALKDRVSTYRGVEDFKKLDEIARKVNSVAIIGGGFLGSELACALGRKGVVYGVHSNIHKGRDSSLTVVQTFPEPGNMGRVLPDYLSKWTMNKIRAEGVTVLPHHDLKSAEVDKENRVTLNFANGEKLTVDHVIVSVGITPNVELGGPSGLEVDPEHGGFRADAELRARSDIWVAGDCCSFYDIKLGRRRVEHHDHAVVSGRLAGENMTGAGKPYWHQSMFWSDLGPDVGFEAIGIVDSSLPTVGVFAKGTAEDTPKGASQQSHEPMRSDAELAAGSSQNLKLPTVKPQPSSPLPGDDYSKGVVFYMNGRQVVGIVLWNVFNRMPIARQILKEGKEYDNFAELAKLFNLRGVPYEADGDDAA